MEKIREWYLHYALAAFYMARLLNVLVTLIILPSTAGIAWLSCTHCFHEECVIIQKAIF
jgi:hypothetical protein